MRSSAAHIQRLGRAILGRVFDRSAADEAAAASRYWAAIGHDMPARERATRLMELRINAPIVKAHRPHFSK